MYILEYDQMNICVIFKDKDSPASDWEAGDGGNVLKFKTKCSPGAAHVCVASVIFMLFVFFAF